MFRTLIKRGVHAFSILEKVPIIDLSNIRDGKILPSDCQIVREAFHNFGCIVVRDPGLSEQKNQSFLNLFEEYFTKREGQIDRGEYVDVSKEHFYEVGLTPPNGFKVSPDFKRLNSLFTGDKTNNNPIPQDSMSKMRYMWNVGTVTPDIPSNIIPQDFPQFQRITDDWGNCIFDAFSLTSELLALGLGLERQIFANNLIGGANKIAPNANNLTRCKEGQIFTSFHNNFSFMTIHGQARFQGLFIWLKNGEKLQVSVPKGHLLIQSGSELEYVTGGYVKSGYHEAVYTEDVQKKVKEAQNKGKIPWRISSTMFTHLRGDFDLHPRGRYLTPQTAKLYPSMAQKEYMRREIEKIQAQ